jgi:integrase
VDYLLKMEKDPEEEMIIHFSLSLSLRRVDISRVLKRDIDIVHEWINFRSKHHVIRSVPFSPDTHQVLERYEAFREEIIEKGKGPEPEELMIGINKTKHNLLTSLKITALDDRLAKIRDRCPFHFTYHDLRRTWARQAWEFGVELTVISFILGHRDTKTSLRYIGIQGDHAREGMAQVYKARMERVANYDKLQSYNMA